MSNFINKNGFNSGFSALFALCLPLLFIGFEPIKWLCCLVIGWFLFFIAVAQLFLFFNEIFDIIGVNTIIPFIAETLFNIAHIPVIIWAYPGLLIVKSMNKIS